MGKPEFSADVIVSTDYSLIGAGSLFNRLTIGTSAAEIKTGASRLSERTTVSIQAHPDNTGYVYLGLDDTVTTTKYFFALAGGAAVELTLDSTDDMEIWAIGSAVSQIVAVLEGRS